MEMFYKWFGFNTTQAQTLDKLFMQITNLISQAGTVITVQRFSPVEDSSVDIQPTSAVITAVIEGASDLGTLHINLPSDATTDIGDIVRVASLIDVTSVTMNGSNIMNPITELFVNDCVGFQKIGVNNWIRIQ
jgi:hypothetical protein